MDVSRRHWMGLASALAVGGAQAALPPPSPPSVRITRRGTRDPRQLIDALSRYATAEMVAYGLPGMVLAIDGPDELRATIALGHADLKTRLAVEHGQLFQIGSISKSMVALLLYTLADKGRLDLDAPVTTVLPDVPWPVERITVAMLLNHTAALSDFAPLWPRSPDGRLWVNYAPGTRFSYSNPGFNLLGLIAARASGMPFHRALQDMVLRPLGMTGSEPLILTRDRARYPTGYTAYRAGSFFPDSPLAEGPWLDIELAAGSVAAPAEDMARYVRFLIQLGRGHGAPLMSDTLAKRYVTPTIDAGDFQPKGRYAAGIATVDVDGRRCLHHTGGMILFHSSITVDPQAGGGVFASTNSAAGGYRPRGITHHGCRLIRAFAEGKPLPSAPRIVAVPAIADATQREGRFLASDGTAITLEAARASLTVFADGVRARVMPGSNGRFTTDHPRLSRHEIAFLPGRQDRLWWGATLYARDNAVVTPPVPAAISGLAGRYLTDDPWTGELSVVARGDQLVLEGAGPLAQAPDGSWRVRGDEMPAERLWFDATLDGRAQRLIFSGVDLRRFHDTTD